MEKVRCYVVKCQYPGRKDFYAISMVLPYEHTKEDFVDHCKRCISEYLPEGFCIKSVSLDWIACSSGKVLWQSAERNND
jgi:hypothetical protein